MAQKIEKKYIGDAQIGSTQILIEKDLSIKGVDQSDTIVDLLKINTAGKAEILGEEIPTLEAFDIAQVVHVEKGGNDLTATGSIAAPFQTIKAAMASITDASPIKRYVIKVFAGIYAETGIVTLKANVFVIGDAKDAVRISASSFALDASFSGSGDNRSGFSQCILLSACDFDWSIVTSAAGKLYFNEVSFNSTVRLYGHTNAIAQAKFDSCEFFGILTVSGINVGVHTNNIHWADIVLNQHPNGGMATILAASGGNCSGTVTLTTTVTDFNRRCSLFARQFLMGGIVVDGASSYADLTSSSIPAAGPTVQNSGNVVYLNQASANQALSNLSYPTAVNQPIIPATTNATNLGDWGKQWYFNFAYVVGSSGTDLYVLSTMPAYDPAGDTVGRSIFINSDGYGLQTNVNGGDIELETAAVSGTGVRGKVKIKARELDLTSAKVTNLADGSATNDAVNKGQLDLKLDANLKGAVNGVAELDAGGKIPSSQLPALAISETFVVASEAAMLALTAQKGDVAVRTDVSKTFILAGSSAAILGDWQEMLTPGDGVVSVNGQTGAVSLDTDDVSEGATNQYFTAARAKSAAVADVLNNGVIDVAPSQNVVFDALATKQASLGTGTTSQYLRGDLTWQTINNGIPKIYTVGVDAGTIAGCIALCTSPSITNAYIVQVPPGSYTEDLTIPGCVSIKGLANPNDSVSVRLTGSHTIFGTATNSLNNRVNIANLLCISTHASTPIFTISGTTDTEVQVTGCYIQNTNVATTAKIFSVGLNGRLYIRNSRTAMASTAGNGGTHFVLAGGSLYADGLVDSSGGTCGIDMTTAGYAQLVNSTMTVSGANVVKVVAGGSVAAGYSSFTNSASVGNGFNLLGVNSVLYASYCTFNIIENAGSYVVNGGAGSAYLFFANLYSNIPGVLSRNIKIHPNVSQLRYANSLLSSDISDFTASVRSAAISDAIADGVLDRAPTQNAVFDALALKLNTALKGAVNGLAELDASGKVPTAQLPSLTITDTFVVVSEAAMLALSAQKGDVAVRTDLSKSFILAGTDPAVLANWQELLSPTTGVVSVNGETGVVSLNTDDVSEGSTNQYFTATRAKAAIVFDREKIVLTSTHITNQYVDLPALINESSLVAYNMRLALHDTDDYVLSTVGGLTRFTFAGDSATGGNSALRAGDVLRFVYVIA